MEMVAMYLVIVCKNSAQSLFHVLCSRCWFVWGFPLELVLLPATAGSMVVREGVLASFPDAPSPPQDARKMKYNSW